MLSPTCRRILVVDDDATVCRFLESALSEVAPVATVSSGAEALAWLLREPVPATILLDVMMPGLDGISTLCWIKANSMTADIPVIMLSARADPMTRRAATRQGAWRYLIKPMELSELVDTVREAVGLTPQPV